MQRIIIDTNVMVSALIQKNYPYFIIYNSVLENCVEICLSTELFEEYFEVLNRPKFRKHQDFTSKAEILLAHIETMH